MICYVSDCQPLFNMVMFADDITLYCNNTNKNPLNSELNKITEWLSFNKSSLNVRESKFIIFHIGQKKSCIEY